MSFSIDDGISVSSRGETNTAIATVENSVKPLQDWEAHHEVQYSISVRSNVNYGQVDTVLLATYIGIERSGPYLSVRDELESGATDFEKERFEVVVLLLGNSKEARGVV
jgi:hypothetical protein